MNLTSAEAAPRVDCIERSQAELISGLNEPAVQRTLGHKALELLEIAQRLYIPNLRNGVLSTPREYRNTDSIPIITANIGEEYWLKPSMAAMNGLQTQRYMQVIDETVEGDYRWNSLELEADIVNRRLMDSAPLRSISLKDRMLAMVSGVRTITDEFTPRGKSESQSFWTWGRPLVVLAFKAPDFPSAALLHELNHVKKIEDNPVLPLEQINYLAEFWGQEFESYDIVNQYSSAIIESGGDSYPGVVSPLGTRFLTGAKDVVKSMKSLAGDSPNLQPERMTPAMLDYMTKIGYAA